MATGNLFKAQSITRNDSGRRQSVTDFLIESGVFEPNFFGNSPRNGADEGEINEGVNLGDQAVEAVEDFVFRLASWGKDSLDEEAFGLLLDGMGYEKCRDGLFEELLGEVADANPNFDRKRRSVSVDDMRSLYQSEPYRLPETREFQSGEALMLYVDKLFRSADLDGDNLLSMEEVKLFLCDLLRYEPSEDVLARAFEALDVDGDGRVSYEEFKPYLLRANVNKPSSCSMEETFLSPFQTSEEDFVNELERFAKNHRAVDHHLLTNLSSAAFGKHEPADLILKFLTAYSKFNSRFISNVEALVNQLDDENHAEILTENLEEEMGHYEEETLHALEEMGIKRDLVEGIPHSKLFTEFVETLECTLERSYSKLIPSEICKDLNDAVDYAISEGKMGLLAALYFGSELIVPQIYSPILQGLRKSIDITNVDARFLILHIDMDQDHADALRDIVIANCRTKEERVAIARCTEKLLDARVTFYDQLIKFSSFVGCHGEFGENRSLGDIAGRPAIFELCSGLVKDAMVLDVGSGDGYVGRTLVGMGAGKVVGVEIDDAMVEAAMSHVERSAREYYISGCAGNIRDKLLKTTNQTNIMPGAQFDIGCFDLTLANFTFNYMNLSAMDNAFKDVFAVLKPGGYFIFSVFHPFSAGSGEEISTDEKKSSDLDYVQLRDRIVECHITAEDAKLEVRVHGKMFDDYINAARDNGFDVVQILEAKATPGSTPVVTAKLRKPDHVQGTSRPLVNALNTLPRKISWKEAEMNEDTFFVTVPDQAKEEIYSAALECFARCVSIDDLDSTGGFLTNKFDSLKVFAEYIRNALLYGPGAVILKGLDLDVFGTDKEKSVACAKMAYFLICQHIGIVDGSARGSLFDVQNSKIDAMRNDVDNVLFSVSDCEAQWHTDGASKDKAYDVVGLLCIHPAATGGESKFSNASNAFDNMQKDLPGFIMHELQRPIPRDILENGKGKGTDSIGGQLSRVESILQLRIAYNSYPIYNIRHDQMRFRYMRHWIETAHLKMKWKTPVFLRIAMDMLDNELDKRCCFNEPLERGDIFITNNAFIAHGRSQFRDSPDRPARHLVRAWIQVQNVDAVKSCY